MTNKFVSHAVYRHALYLYEKMENIFDSGMPEDMKLDFILSEDIDWFKENIGFQFAKQPAKFADGDVKVFLNRLRSVISNLETTRSQPTVHLQTDDIGNGLYI